MIHVAEVEAGLNWYQHAFPAAVRRQLPEQDFEYLTLGEINLEIVPADGKVTSGAAGTVVYWQVADFDQTLHHLIRLGAVLYRGPMTIEDGQRMCQIRDPWGNCIGLRGP